MRPTPEDFARLYPTAGDNLTSSVPCDPDNPPELPPERSENITAGVISVAEFSYPQITARDLSIRLQPLCLQSAFRHDFKVRGFL
ncbi:hypothetical protein FX276_21325 [Salmonella enterica]|nr:hypothetical protein [Salmonella enterica]